MDISVENDILTLTLNGKKRKYCLTKLSDSIFRLIEEDYIITVIGRKVIALSLEDNDTYAFILEPLVTPDNFITVHTDSDGKSTLYFNTQEEVFALSCVFNPEFNNYRITDPIYTILYMYEHDTTTHQMCISNKTEPIIDALEVEAVEFREGITVLIFHNIYPEDLVDL